MADTVAAIPLSQVRLPKLHNYLFSDSFTNLTEKADFFPLRVLAMELSLVLGLFLR